MEYDQDVSILPAFRKLVNLYWTLDQSEAFEILQTSRHGSSTPRVLNQNKLCSLQKKLQDITFNSSATNDVQAADISVTRAWMCTIIWRMATNCDASLKPDESATSLTWPMEIATEFLEQTAGLSSAVLDAHGRSIVS